MWGEGLHWRHNGQCDRCQHRRHCTAYDKYEWIEVTSDKRILCLLDHRVETNLFSESVECVDCEDLVVSSFESGAHSTALASRSREHDWQRSVHVLQGMCGAHCCRTAERPQLCKWYWAEIWPKAKSQVIISFRSLSNAYVLRQTNSCSLCCELTIKSPLVSSLLSTVTEATELTGTEGYSTLRHSKSNIFAAKGNNRGFVRDWLERTSAVSRLSPTLG